MSSPELCRVVLVTPFRTLELALPAVVPLCDLLPVLVHRATSFGSPERAGRGPGLSGEGDWVIQRLGGNPLDEDLTPTDLQIRDGETLYLRPRDAQLPPAHFDDLIDGLATGVRARPDRWRDSMTRALFLALAAVTLTTCFAVLLDHALRERGALAAAVAGLLVLGAAMFSRALGDNWGALLCGVAALPFAWLAGFLVPGNVGPVELGPAQVVAAVLSTDGLDRLTMAAPHLLAAFAAMTAVAVLTTGAAGGYRPVFLAAWLAGAAGTFGALLVTLGLAPGETAGSIVGLVLVVSTFAPSTAFRLARLRLPRLPTGATDLAEDIEPYPAPQLMAGAALADTYLTWLLVAAGVVQAAGTLVLFRRGGATAYAMIGAVSLVLLIRSRGLTSAWQRGSTLLPAVTGLALMAVHFSADPEPRRRLLALTGLLFLAGIMLALSRAMPGRRILPHWGRIADVVEYLAAGAVMLLLLGLLDAFHWARALAG